MTAPPTWLVDGRRTAFGRFGGALRELALVDLAGQTVSGTTAATEWPIELVDELIMGVAMVGGGNMVPARLVSVTCGLPIELPSLSIDRACCSGMTAVGLASRSIAGGARSVLAVGAESMSNTPRLLHDTRWGNRRGDLVVEDLLLMRSPLTGTAIATYVGHVALRYGVSREDQDQWALRSHQRWFAAHEHGYFDGEILPLDLAGQVHAVDEPPRKDTSLDALSRLSTVAESPTVTAGNAPGLNDGAAALIVAGDGAVEASGATPLARIVDYVQLSGEADSSAYLPGIAIRQLLDRSGLDADDLDVIEINEAFAATPLVSIRHLVDRDAGAERDLLERTNAHGGAVALGHPVGASGARLVLTAARALHSTDGRFAVAAICGGFGQTDAVLLERAR